MPQKNRTAYLQYQRCYYQRHQQQLRRRARLRQRLKRGTYTLWHLFPDPYGFCRAMAYKALHQTGGDFPASLTLEDLQQDMAEALVQGRTASQCRNPTQYAAALLIRLAVRRIRQEQARTYHEESQHAHPISG